MQTKSFITTLVLALLLAGGVASAEEFEWGKNEGRVVRSNLHLEGRGIGQRFKNKMIFFNQGAQPLWHRIPRSLVGSQLQGARNQQTLRFEARAQVLETGRAAINGRLQPRIVWNRGSRLAQFRNQTAMALSGTRRAGNRLAQGSVFFKGSREHRYRGPVKAHVIPEESYVKEDLALYVQAKSYDGLLHVEDDMMPEGWDTWMVSHPVLRKVGRDYVAQAGFFGVSGDSHIHPLVLQFYLKGNDQSWHVRSVDVVTAGQAPREGMASLIRWTMNNEQLVVEELPSNFQ